MRDKDKSAIRELALDRMEQATVSLRENRPSANVNSYKLRAGHIEELEEQSTAFLSDAIELLEEEKSTETVLDLLNAADTQLAAIQDLLIQQEHAWSLRIPAKLFTR